MPWNSDAKFSKNSSSQSSSMIRPSLVEVYETEWVQPVGINRDLEDGAMSKAFFEVWGFLWGRVFVDCDGIWEKRWGAKEKFRSAGRERDKDSQARGETGWSGYRFFSKGREGI